MKVNGIPAEWYNVNEKPDSPKGLRLTVPRGTNKCQISIAIGRAMEVDGCTEVDIVGYRMRFLYWHGKHK